MTTVSSCRRGVDASSLQPDEDLLCPPLERRNIQFGAHEHAIWEFILGDSLALGTFHVSAFRIFVSSLRRDAPLLVV